MGVFSVVILSFCAALRVFSVASRDNHAEATEKTYNAAQKDRTTAEETHNVEASVRHCINAGGARE